MDDLLTKLRPDRDLQCYFERPSAIAALSSATPMSFLVSGTWRQQFDWAVVEWNRDNVIEHPRLRNLPDGDLSELLLTYDESRENCYPVDSDVYPTVDWPYLRVWADPGTGENVYYVPLRDHAEAILGSYQAASAELELFGTPTAGDYAGISFLTEHRTYQLYGTDDLSSVVRNIAESINTFPCGLQATPMGNKLRLLYVGDGQTIEASTTGANGNRLGAYGFTHGSGNLFWSPQWRVFSGGQSPSTWRITLPFNDLHGYAGPYDRTTKVRIPTHNIRKMRWTYAADLQRGEFTRSEFAVRVHNWTVTDERRVYSVAGPGSRRVEDDSPSIRYEGEWRVARGNFSGGTIRDAHRTGSLFKHTYLASGNHSLYLGTRLAHNGARVRIRVNGGEEIVKNLRAAGEDTLARMFIGTYGPGTHELTVQHDGPDGAYFFFDFLELAVPTTALPVAVTQPLITPATDWDTDHSLAIAAERTAWLINVLGFKGRVNHYVGAMWFYELEKVDHEYASLSVDFSGHPEFSRITELAIGRVGEDASRRTLIQHVHRIGETAETLAKAFELELNRGYTAIRAEAVGSRLIIYARAMGVEGNQITIDASSTADTLAIEVPGDRLSGGREGRWCTDLKAKPRLNRAVRDWSRGFFTALRNYGLDAASAFSMELQHGNDTLEAGIAQRYPDANGGSGAPVWLNTPALQTNFSTESRKFWAEVYTEMAGLMAECGIRPYLQFGEVQWWYFPPWGGVGMPFYDEFTRNRFQAEYGRPLRYIVNEHVDPADYREEAEFLPRLIGEFTDHVMEAVRRHYPDCRFEVLYPPDVNESPFNRLINYPRESWTPTTLDCLKTESFIYTYSMRLDKSLSTIRFPETMGFSPSKRSWLVGIGDSYTNWKKEVRNALRHGVESVVLFALDQFCLIGYPVPLKERTCRSRFQG